MADGTWPVRAVTRAMDVLLSLEDGPQSLAKTADATGLTKPAAHRRATADPAASHGEVAV